jgi:hypothetical protein
MAVLGAPRLAWVSVFLVAIEVVVVGAGLDTVEEVVVSGGIDVLPAMVGGGRTAEDVPSIVRVLGAEWLTLDTPNAAKALTLRMDRSLDRTFVRKCWGFIGFAFTHGATPRGATRG